MRRFLYLLSLILVIVSCDSGDIEESSYQISSNGKTVKVMAHIQGMGAWEESDYTVAIAGFSHDSKYAVMQRALPASVEDGNMEVVLSNVSSSVNTVELAITNKLRKRIISLANIKMDDYEDHTPQDTIYLDLGNIDVDLMGCMQYGIFNQACIQCHGANGRKAGNLDLTAGNAKSNLVNVASTQREGYTRVCSGNPEESLLRLILHEGGENILHYNHTEVLSSQFKENLEEVKQIIDDWIKSLGN